MAVRMIKRKAYKGPPLTKKQLGTRKRMESKMQGGPGPKKSK